ncbi:MAG TPA: Ku protein, partial [Gemmatimonas sp.]|nr:Ku protein [Gemmatimonas sp.]
SIDILGFVHEGDIDLAYFDKPYVVGPLKGSEKAYALFVKALEETERVGIAQIVIRTKQHIAAIYPYHQAIMVHLLRYEEELRQPSALGIEEGTDARRLIRPQELTMAEKLVESMTTTWDPAQYRDSYRDDLMALIAERSAQRGKKGATVVSPGDGPPARVLDLMSALKGSLAANARGRAARSGADAGKVVSKRSTSKAAAKRRTTRKSA